MDNSVIDLDCILHEARKKKPEELADFFVSHVNDAPEETKQEVATLSTLFLSEEADLLRLFEGTPTPYSQEILCSVLAPYLNNPTILLPRIKKIKDKQARQNALFLLSNHIDSDVFQRWWQEVIDFSGSDLECQVFLLDHAILFGDEELAPKIISLPLFEDVIMLRRDLSSVCQRPENHRLLLESALKIEDLMYRASEIGRLMRFMSNDLQHETLELYRGKPWEYTAVVVQCAYRTLSLKLKALARDVLETAPRFNAWQPEQFSGLLSQAQRIKGAKGAEAVQYIAVHMPADPPKEFLKTYIPVLEACTGDYFLNMKFVLPYLSTLPDFEKQYLPSIVKKIYSNATQFQGVLFSLRISEVEPYLPDEYLPDWYDLNQQFGAAWFDFLRYTARRFIAISVDDFIERGIIEVVNDAVMGDLGVAMNGVETMAALLRASPGVSVDTLFEKSFDIIEPGLQINVLTRLFPHMKAKKQVEVLRGLSEWMTPLDFLFFSGECLPLTFEKPRDILIQMRQRVALDLPSVKSWN